MGEYDDKSVDKEDGGNGQAGPNEGEVDSCLQQGNRRAALHTALKARLEAAHLL